MTNSASDLAIVSGSAHPTFANEIAKKIGIDICPVTISSFQDNEQKVIIQKSVRGKNVFVVQPTALNPNHYIMELLIIIDALRRASAESITAVIPYFGYSRQDRKDTPREPITAKLVANMLATAGAQHLLTMDLHAPQIEGFFDIPVDNLRAQGILIDALQDLPKDNLVVVAPDIGSVKIARTYATALNTEFVVIDKQRHNDNVEILNIIGNVSGKDVLLADDMCTTGSTLVSAAKACHEKGANTLYAVVTHGVFVGNAVADIENSPLEWILSTNSVPKNERLARSTKFREVSAASLFAQAIACSAEHKSISSLYK